MWAILKFDKKKLAFLEKEFSKKLGKDYIIYIPKLFFQKYKNNKLINKEFNLLGDYLFCFHKNLRYDRTVNSLGYTRGVKYFLNGFARSQKEIQKFVNKCKESENKRGHLSQDFFEININSRYKFSTGPFTNMIFKIIELQRNKINILMGDIKTTIKKKEFLFRPI
tara:strand:+ start:33 stop:530 length:498 start_codon:yes stop_codon:yes gene_type:complete